MTAAARVPGMPLQVVVDGGRLGYLARRLIDRGAQVVVRRDGATLGPLAPVLDRIRNLSVIAAEAIDLEPLSAMSSLETLSLSVDRPGLSVDLSHLPSLTRVALTTANAWRRAGSAIAAPQVESIGIWSPEESLFQEHPTRASRIRLALVRKLRGLPPVSHPQRVADLWVQQAPPFDLAGIEAWVGLERLRVEKVRTLTGFGRLRALPQLRDLAVGEVGEVDDPSALIDLPLSRFSEWTEKSQADRIWWLPDLELLQARGVDALTPEWRALRAAYEDRWSRRTGRRIPRHFSTGR